MVVCLEDAKWARLAHGENSDPRRRLQPQKDHNINTQQVNSSAIQISFRMAAANPLRTYVITGAVAAITATGAWYGAGLKAQHEHKQVNKSPPDIYVPKRLANMYVGSPSSARNTTGRPDRANGTLKGETSDPACRAADEDRSAGCEECWY